jgi:hypothetical protein
MEPNTSPQPKPVQPESNPAQQSAEVANKPEVMPAPAETAPSAPVDPAPVTSPVVPLPAMPPATVDPTVTTTQPVADTPAIADDVDVIEKEWVDKAQDVIEKTKDDPYQEEEQIEALQRDYLKKRYGKEVGDSEVA